MNDKTIPEIFFKREGRLNRWRYFKRNVVLGIISSFIMVVLNCFLATLTKIFRRPAMYFYLLR